MIIDEPIVIEMMQEIVAAGLAVNISEHMDKYPAVFKTKVKA
jgi:hypothetical protein